MRICRVWSVCAAVLLTSGLSTIASAQDPQPPTREAAIQQQEAEKAKHLKPYELNKAEKFLNNFEYVLTQGTPSFHPFLSNAYSGGGFALGAGYIKHVSGYNYFDVRGSYSIKQYKRAEVEFVAPRLFNRRGSLSVLGGWREAMEVGFYGFGTDTSLDDRANFGFRRPAISAEFEIYPTRRNFVLGAGAEWSQWKLQPGTGSAPSVETVYTRATLPGLGAKTDYLHTQGTIGFDWRTSKGYTRRGGYYGVTVHDFSDQDDVYGFNQIDYEAIQHIPILRETWVISLHSRVQTAYNKDNQQVPFFLLPSVGGGHSLRGYTSWRFRDMNSVLVQAEWRIMANRFLDLAFFYDAGKVTAKRSDLDLNGLKSDYGLGVRFHGPFATPLRIEVARSREATALVFSSGAIF